MTDAKNGILMPSSDPAGLMCRLSGNDAVTLLEIINQCIHCRMEDEFIGIFPKIQELFPFAFAGTLLGNIVNVNGNGNGNGNGLVITHGANISFPEEWLREYLSKNYFHLDGATKETFVTGRLKRWSYLTDDYDVKAPKEVMSLNMDFGVREGYMHGAGLPAPRGKRSVFCFAGGSLKEDKRTADILELLVPHLHLALFHIFDNRPSNLNGKILSAREKEVLNWLKQGKSSWDMSVILGISERTVNYHIYNIMAKLDAINRPQAVAIATRLGLISEG